MIEYGQRADPRDWAEQEGIEDVIFGVDALNATGIAGFLLCLDCGTAAKDEADCWLCGKPYTHKRKCEWMHAGAYRFWNEPLPAPVRA